MTSCFFLSMGDSPLSIILPLTDWGGVMIICACWLLTKSLRAASSFPKSPLLSSERAMFFLHRAIRGLISLLLRVGVWLGVLVFLSLNKTWYFLALGEVKSHSISFSFCWLNVTTLHGGLAYPEIMQNFAADGDSALFALVTVEEFFPEFSLFSSSFGILLRLVE